MVRYSKEEIEMNDAIVFRTEVDADRRDKDQINAEGEDRAFWRSS